MKLYITRTGNGYAETIDEVYSIEEAEELRREYQLSDNQAKYSISYHPCSNWK